ncbi:MAG: SoxR reducing system RseC family protein [Candidatus Riflemargulisbacteria bacterium]
MADVQEGVVLKNEGNFSRLHVAMHFSCDDCGACQSPELEILAYNDSNTQVGQTVRFIMNNNNMIKVSFILFFLPLVSIFIGAYLGYLLAPFLPINNTLTMVIGGGFFLLLSIINIIFQDRKYSLKPGNFAQIIEVVS